MKKHLILFALVINFFLIFTACTKENNNISTLSLENLNGTWIITNIQRIGNNCTSVIDADVTDNCAELNNILFCDEGKMIFDNGLYTFIYNAYENGVLNEDWSSRSESTYQIDGNTIITCDIDAPNECQTSTGNLTMLGDELTFTSEDDTVNCTQIIKARRL